MDEILQDIAQLRTKIKLIANKDNFKNKALWNKYSEDLKTISSFIKIIIEKEVNMILLKNCDQVKRYNNVSGGENKLTKKEFLFLKTFGTRICNI